jgi:YebC/PmpR family DNA-binding regulatory protein
MIQALTDNPTRTVADVRFTLSRGGGTLGAANSVSWMFDRKGQIMLDSAGRDENAVMEAALEAGAEDVVRDDERFVVTTDPATLHAVKEAMAAAEFAATEASISWIPKNTVAVEGETAEKLLKLLEDLEDMDDIQKVDANFDMDLSQFATA